MSLFYFFTIVFILWELNTLIFTKSYNDFLESSIQRIQTQKVTTDDIVFSLFNLSYFIWTSIGIFTNQYLGFLLLLILGVVSATVSKKIKKSNIDRILLHRRIDAVISIVILVLIWFSQY